MEFRVENFHVYKVLPYALVRIPSRKHSPPPPPPFFGFDMFMNYAKIRQYTLGATVITFLSLPASLSDRIRDVI